MKKILILFAVTFVLFNLGYINAFECYQESANQTNQTGIDGNCGLNYSGNYDINMESEIIDGNWSTLSNINNQYRFINYTKPNNYTLISIKFIIKDDQGLFNVTIPYSCLNYSLEYLYLYARTFFSLGNGLQYACKYSSNDWLTLNQSDVIASFRNISEEAIFWDVIANSSNSSSSSDGNINLSLIKPSGYYYGGSYIPLQINISNSTPYDKCWYNITKGSMTLEIPDTFISNCSSTQFIVSENANYLINVCVNDTLNNKTCVNTIFTTIPSPPGGGSTSSGGGGGSYVPEEKNETIKVSVCEKNYPPLKDAWKIFKEKSSWFNFKILWFAYWDYALCKSGSNIIPLE